MERTGILNRTAEAKQKISHAQIYEEMQLEAQSYVVEKKVGTYTNSFTDYLKSKGIIDDEGIINVVSLTGSKTTYGNGTSIESGDVYVLEEMTSVGKLATTTNVKVASTDNTTIEYKIVYYGKTESENVELGALFSEASSTNDLKYAYLFCVDQDGVVRLNPSYSFYYACYYLTSKDGYKLTNVSLIIPSSIDGQEVTTIGGMANSEDWSAYCFQRILELKKIKVPNTVTTIETYAFYSTALKEIQLPASVTRVEDCAFLDSGIEKVYYEGTEEQWNAITIGSRNEALTRANIIYNYTGNDIVEYAEETSTKISPETLYLTYTTNDEEKTASIKGDSAGSSYATALNISSDYTVDGVTYNVTSIENFAFNGWKGLERITIPSSITSIGYGAFNGCTALETVYFDGTVEQWIALVSQDSSGILANCNVQLGGAIIGTTEYKSLQEAVNAVPSNKQTTIKLIKDSAGNIEISSDKNIILDLNGYTLNEGIGYHIYNEGTLEIKNGTVSSSNLAICNDGTMIIDGGNISTTSEDPTIMNYGTMTISGGTITGNSEFGVILNLGIRSEEGYPGILTVTGGSIISTEYYCIYSACGTIDVGANATLITNNEIKIYEE